MDKVLVLIIGLCGGYVFGDTRQKAALDLCDTEVLQVLIQLNNDREAYFQGIAECEAGKKP